MLCSLCSFHPRDKVKVEIKLRTVRSKQCEVKNICQWNFPKNSNNLLCKFLLFSIIIYLFISFIFYHYVLIWYMKDSLIVNCKNKWWMRINEKKQQKK